MEKLSYMNDTASSPILTLRHASRAPLMASLWYAARSLFRLRNVEEITFKSPSIFAPSDVITSVLPKPHVVCYTFGFGSRSDLQLSQKFLEALEVISSTFLIKTTIQQLVQQSSYRELIMKNVLYRCAQLPYMEINPKWLRKCLLMPPTVKSLGWLSSMATNWLTSILKYQLKNN